MAGKKTIGVGQSGGPTSVINDTLAGVLYEAQQRGIRVIGLRNGLEGGGLNSSIKGNLIDLSNVNPYFLRGIPGAYLGTTRLRFKKDRKEDTERIFKAKQNLDKLIDVLIYIGGNDSADTLLLYEKGIHVEKTEDNDLMENDHTSGWGSASLANSELIRALTPDVSGFNPRTNFQGREIYSTAPVIVYQTQGRDTGWLVYGCAFAKVNHASDVIENASPHIFLNKENKYDKNELLSEVENLLIKQGFAFIVCGEELLDKEGKILSESFGIRNRKDESGHAEHSRSGSFNYADFIASEIKKGLEREVHIINGYMKLKETPITPHHIQRTFKRSYVDAQEAFYAGRESVSAFDDGDIGISIALKRYGDSYNIQPARINLKDIAGKVRKVDEKYLGGLKGPKEKFYEDFLPLIGGSLSMTHYVGPDLIPISENYKT